ncbi:unnamed protein product [Dibothriocephalus latus]|uniref:Uncharacterized protein n=1 Tax=Dibothriocephalus latus TaxID=60516 RepID=A0A3P7MM80_DIBLA|nr:unnamed protein product [Dibothriocephalus latus]
MPDHSLRSVCSYRLVRPAKSVDEVSGSCVSSLRMKFSRTNQFIIILLGSAFFLFLAFVAISNGRGLLLHNRDFTPLPRVAENPYDQIGGKTSDTLERKSSYLVRQHARHLNSAFLAFTRRNEKQLRQRMSRFTSRIRHDLSTDPGIKLLP